MNKYILAIGSILIISNSICSAMSAQQVKDDFSSAIEFAFFKTGDMNQVKKTFYNYPLNSTAINRCNKAIANIKSFVNDNSKNLLGTKDTLLKDSAAQLEKIMTSTINAINEIYNNKKLDSDVYFTQLDTACNNTKAMLKQESFSSAKKKEAQDVLIYALNSLSNVIITAKEASIIARRAALA